MTDLPQNELFSAYLDGELTAAERAEMEQLLATNPAARQLLDELRSLSTTLQSLPRETLGEDLGRQVLRVAERRMLTEGGPGDDETAPMPLARSLFQRFATRRNVVWLAITASIAIMVLINEQRQGSRPVQIARQSAPAASAEKARQPGPPPTIQAAHDVAADAPGQSYKRAEKKLDRDAAADHYKAEESVAKSVERSAEPPESSLREEPAGGMAPAAPIPPQSEPAPAAPKGAAETERIRGQRGAMAGKAGQKDVNAEHAEGLADVDASVLIVYCDISPKADASQAFEKLLDANGIARNERLGRIDKAKQEQAKDAKQRVASDESSERADAAANENFVYVEASPAQIAATLAGLTAQPDVFLAVSIKPAHDEQSRAMVRRYGGRNNVAGEVGSGFAARSSKMAARSPAKADKPADALKNGPAMLGPAAAPALESPADQETEPETTATTTEQQPSPSAAEVPGQTAKPAKEQRQMAKQLQPQQLAQSIVRQRVLFVMRVVDADQPPAELPTQQK